MLKVAFASADRIHVTEHFGTARCLVIYGIDDHRAHCLALAEFPEELPEGHNEGRLAARIAAIEGCAAVYCLAVGGSAVRQLLARGIQPIRLAEPEPIERVLGELRAAIRLGGVPWIDRALGKKADPERFARIAAEGWDE